MTSAPPPERSGDWTGFWLLVALTLIAVVAFVAMALNVGKPPPAPGPPHWQGRVNYVLFCASATRGQAGGLDAESVVDELSFPSFPARVDLMLVVSLTPDRPGRRYRIAKLDPGADPTRGQSHELPVAAAVAPGRPAVSVLALPGFAVPRAGDVAFRVLCDDVVIAERILLVSGRATTTQPAE